MIAPGEPLRLAFDGSERASIGRLLVATLVFAVLYALLEPASLFAITAVFTWEMLRWLLLSVMLVPILFGFGLFGLLKGALPAGLLIGAVAVRTPDRVWPKLLAAGTLPLVDLMLLRQALPARLLEQGMRLLMDHRALFALDTMAPLAASVLAALLVPQRLVRRLRLGSARTRRRPEPLETDYKGS